MKKLLVLGTILTAACCLAYSQAAPTMKSKHGEAIGISWDKATLRFVHNGTYGRMRRLTNRDLICSYENESSAWVIRSRNGGKSWEVPVLVKKIEGASASNAETLQLQSGRLLLFYNQRPRRNSGKNFTIGMCWSDDNGRTWTPRESPLFDAGPDWDNGCWEPAAIQLPSGEIQVFFANEAPYTQNNDQEISLLRSLDGGQTWSKPETVSFRAGHRDGMPVPLLLRDGKTIVYAIEDNGLSEGAQLQPAIIHSTLEHNWHQSVVTGSSPHRWNALDEPLPAPVYAGAPYLRQLPTGETILCCQSQEGGRSKPEMAVYIGDENARFFAHKSVPFEIPADVGGWWNSLFIKDAQTVTALSDTNINGRSGLWAIDGHVQRN